MKTKTELVCVMRINVSVPVKFEWYMTNFETEVATCIGNSHLRYQRGNVWSAKLGRDKHNLAMQNRNSVCDEKVNVSVKFEY